MLDPEYLLRISEGAEDIAEMLHNKVIKRVVGRVMTRVAKGKDYLLTARDKWELESLQEAGLLAEDLIKEIAAATKKQQQEIREAFGDSGVRTIRYDNAIYQAAGISAQPLEQSPQLVRVLERGYKATMGEWENFTRTYANAGQRAYLKAVDKAYVLTQSGTVSYSEAVKEAIEEIAAAGGVKVDYPSGRSDTIETATLRAVRTGIAQTCAEVTQRRMDEVGWDIVLTSAHLGARTGDGMDNHTNHFWWQGRFFSRSGNDPRFPPFRVCGLGDVQGISGANCRHSFGPGDGEHNPYQDFDSDENQKAYEMTQRARELERRIRNTKREVMGLRAALDAPSVDPKALTDVQKAYDRKAAVLQRQNKEYNEFCDTNNFKKRDDRITVAQWDRHQASMARVAAKRHNVELENRAKHDKIIKEIKTTKAIPPQATINIPPKHIDTSGYLFDYQHINEERNHNVTREMAEAWIRESKISASVWNGRFENFYGENGCVYVDITNTQIRTAFSKEEYTDRLQLLMEVLADNDL